MSAAPVRAMLIIEKIEYSLLFFPFFFSGRLLHTAQHWPGTHCVTQGQEQDRRTENAFFIFNYFH
ncbi:hypothetical protein GQ37_023335 [Janthinobacterium sp. BJB1]|nr:hypothetical protein GQ37_023335 [Janthinobacterium sp. BJB1]